jgi:NTE family protein
MRSWLKLPALRFGKRPSGFPPKLGLALGGGFARGIAHIGVLQVLEEEGIPVDLIAGTSSGSVIAAAFASGCSAKELAEIASKLRMKDVGRWTISKLGLNSNARMEVFLRRLLHCATFEEMRIPLLIPATDLVSGEVTVFKSGCVIDAIRASCAYPLMYQPVRIDGRYYMDGGLVCAVPAEPLREAGATKIISVELTPHWMTNEPRNMFEVLEQSVSIAIMRAAPLWRAMSDVLVQPQINGIAHDAFHRHLELIEAGRKATQRVLPRIRAWLEKPPKLEPVAESVVVS